MQTMEPSDKIINDLQRIILMLSRENNLIKERIEVLGSV